MTLASHPTQPAHSSACFPPELQRLSKTTFSDLKKTDQNRCQNWKPGFNWYCSTVIILKGIVWSNTCNVSTHSSLSYRIIGLSFCIEQYIQCEINTFTQMDIIVVAHLYDTHHKNIQVIVSFFFFIYWCEAHLKSTNMFSITLQGRLLNVTLLRHEGPFVYKYSLYPNASLQCFPPRDQFPIAGSAAANSGSYIWGLNTTKWLNTAELVGSTHFGLSSFQGQPR